MKKILKLILFYALVILLAPILVFARGNPHRHSSPTPPSNPTPIAPTNGVQWGVFNEGKAFSPTPAWTETFTDGAFPSGTGNLVIFLEPPYTDAQILNGQFDSQLETFSVTASQHSGQVILALGEEVNCDNSDPWGGAYKGNTVASTIAAFQHEATIVKGIAKNVKIAYSSNNDSCYGEPSALAYYPGNAYTDIVGVDGFDFGGQTWDQVFDHAVTPLQSLGKPIWILSEGVVSSDNQSAFISATFAGTKTYNLGGFIYFNYTGGGNFELGSSALSTLKSLIQ